MSKSRIAIALSLMFAAPAAVVAFDQYSSAEAVSAEAEPITVAEVSEGTLVTVSDSEITIEPVAVITEQSELPAPAAAIPARLEFSYNSKTFPGSGAVEDKEPLPRQAAYLERLHQERSGQLSIASATWNPGSTEPDLYQPLPKQMAYFNSKEQQQIASMQPSVVASSDSQSRSSQLAMADTSSPAE